MKKEYRLVELRQEGSNHPYWIIEEKIRSFFVGHDWAELEMENIFHDYDTAVAKLKAYRGETSKVIRKVLEV